MDTKVERAIRISAFDGLALFARDHGPIHGLRLPVICLPGLTRNSLDYEDLAPRIAATGRRVICPDLRGRGQSGYDPEWQANYAPTVYVRDVLDLMASIGIHRAIFIGTSLGGILGMMLAAARPTAMAGLVMNDIGPRIETAGLLRIASYVGREEPLPDWPAAVAQLKAAYAIGLPNLDTAKWERFARRQYVERVEGGLRLNYDPHIGDAMRANKAPPADLGAAFKALGPIPALVLRGTLSDILSEDGLALMRSLKPDIVTAMVAGVGHAPMLDELDALAAIDAFLADLP